MSLDWHFWVNESIESVFKFACKTRSFSFSSVWLGRWWCFGCVWVFSVSFACFFFLSFSSSHFNDSFRQKFVARCMFTLCAHEFFFDFCFLFFLIFLFCCFLLVFYRSFWSHIYGNNCASIGWSLAIQFMPSRRDFTVFTIFSLLLFLCSFLSPVLRSGPVVMNTTRNEPKKRQTQKKKKMQNQNNEQNDETEERKMRKTQSDFKRKLSIFCLIHTFRLFTALAGF